MASPGPRTTPGRRGRSAAAAPGRAPDRRPTNPGSTSAAASFRPSRHLSVVPRALLLAVALLLATDASSQSRSGPGEAPGDGLAAGPPVGAPPAIATPAPASASSAAAAGPASLLAAVPGLPTVRPPLRAGPPPGPVGEPDAGTALLRALIPGSPVPEEELARDRAAAVPPPEPDGVLRQAVAPPSRHPAAIAAPFDARDAVQKSGGIVFQRSSP